MTQAELKTKAGELGLEVEEPINMARTKGVDIPQWVDAQLKLAQLYATLATVK